MIFNSLTFFVFFLFFFSLYWFVFNKNLKSQNILLLVGSYVFYGWADLRFLLLLIIISALNFFLGISIERASSSKRKNIFIYLGLIQGIGALAFFKYFNFFVDPVTNALQFIGIHVNFHFINIVVPLGISFFTFKIISYLMDIDKGKIPACKNWIDFFVYVSFFPALLSGPIDRAATFMPQLKRKRSFTYDDATNGLTQILWGLFKKVVIADNCSPIVDQIFDSYQILPASSLVIGAFLLTIQWYADFSGYSDMAIGTSKLLGFNITRNFDYPFFSQSIAEFWRKWHISLTSWLTDYVFTPTSIALRNYGKWGLIGAILITFILMGIWHGANGTFVLFGFIHGCFFISIIWSGKFNRKKSTEKQGLQSFLIKWINIAITFSIVMLSIVILRADSVSTAFDFYARLISPSILLMPGLSKQLLITLALIIFTIGTEYWQRDEAEFAAGITLKKKFPVVFYTAMLLLILFFMNSSAKIPFIYFKF